MLDFLASCTSALSIRDVGGSSTMPFEFTYQDLQIPLEIALEIANDSEIDESVLGWQLELNLQALDPAQQGALQFNDVAAPPDSLFGPTPGPQSNPVVPPPSDVIFVADADMTEAFGQSIPQHSARNILQLTLVANLNTAGSFQLVMPEAVDLEQDSSWFDADENDFGPKPFENSAPSAFSGFILLGTIHVTETTIQPGDYDRSGTVDANDYNHWMAQFGSVVEEAGGGADGNGDMIVDAADYVVWRAYVSKIAIGNITIANVPEPGSITLVALGLAIAIGVIHLEKRKTMNC
jgi:hypothetical protein